ncbi:HEAT repeat protein [Trichuris suis]|nr:HEAT repeat protein [Trichuris suis]
MKESAVKKVNERKRYQDEEFCLKYLPYYDQACIEADAWLSEIKCGIGESLLKRETPDGLSYWFTQLDSYICIYGMRFAKEDHVNFIRITYGLATTPDLDISLVTSLCELIGLLLKKVHLISRDDLQIDWMPLYKLHKRINRKYGDVNAPVVPSELREALKKAIRRLSSYFHENATREILNFFLPKFSPWNVSTAPVFITMTTFLPTKLPPSEMKNGFQLWIEEMMNLWKTYHGKGLWEGDLINLLARVAYDNSGHIDWNCHMDFIFTKILRSFRLVVKDSRDSAKTRLSSSFHSCALDEFPMWVAAMIGKGSNALQCLKVLLKAVQPYCHPSNTGAWQASIFGFLRRLSCAICKRVKFERRKTNFWFNWVPEDGKLTDENIKEYVNVALPCVISGVFSKCKSDHVPACLHYLANLNASAVVPEILKCCDTSILAINEPHRLTESLLCLENVATSLLRSPDSITYGLQLIPILKAILPQMNMYDIDKLCAILNTLSAYFSLIPLVNSSSAQWELNSLTQEEKELCSMTAVLEDVIEETFDRIFFITLNFGAHASEGQPERVKCSSDSSNTDSEEGTVAGKLIVLASCILFNCEAPTYEALVNRILRFVEENAFESDFGHQIVRDICAAACKVSPEKSFDKFFYLFRSRLEHAIDERTRSADRVEAPILRDVEMLSAIISVSGSVLTKFCAEIFDALQLIGSLSSKNAAPIFGHCLTSVLRPLCGISLAEQLFNFELLSSSSKAFLPIKNWAKSVGSEEAFPNWNIPGQSELSMAENVLNTFLIPALESLENPEKLNKNRLLSTLYIVRGCCKGLFGVLPHLEGDAVAPGCRISNVASYCGPSVHPDKCHVLRLERNTKNVIRKVLTKLVDYMIECREDETGSMKMIVEIYIELIVPLGHFKNFCIPSPEKDKSFDLAFRDETVRRVDQPAAWLRRNVAVLHQIYLNSSHSYQKLTTEHLTVAKDLLKLCLSQYPKTRGNALTALEDVFEMCKFVGKMVVDDVLEYIKEGENVSLEHFEGAIHVLRCNRGSEFLCRRDWSVISKTWTALMRTPVPDKMSISVILSATMGLGLANFCSFAIESHIPDDVAALANCLWQVTDRDEVVPCRPIPEQHEIDSSIEKLKKENENNLQVTKALLHQMVEAGKDKTIPSGHLLMAWRILFTTVDRDSGLLAEHVSVFVNMLTDCREPVRKFALNAIALHLSCRVRKADKVIFQCPIEPIKSDSLQRRYLQYSLREDNIICLYNRDVLPKSVDEWNTTQFITKAAVGLDFWPRYNIYVSLFAELMVQAPLKMQPSSDRQKAELEEDEANIYTAFEDENFLRQFADLMSVEIKANDEVERVHASYQFFFQAMFRNFGFPMWKIFRGTVERLVDSNRLEKQRLAAEIVSGLISGMKLWRYECQQECQLWIISVMKAAFNNMNLKASHCWATALGFGLIRDDPRRCSLFIDSLIEYLKNPCGTASKRLCEYFALNCVFTLHSWRLILVYSELLKYLQNQLAEDYADLRECIGRSLHLMLSYSSLRNETALELPDRETFIRQCLERIKVLEVEINLECPGATSASPNGSGVDVLTRGERERKESLLTLQTLLCFLKFCLSDMGRTVSADSVKVLPYLFYFDNETSDASLKKMCRHALRGYFPQCFLTETTASLVLDQCEMTARKAWWKARVSVLQFLQVCIFSNIFSFSDQVYRNRVSELIMCLLRDQQVEVRKAASKSFCTFFQCGFMEPDDSTYLGTWIEWSKSKDTITRHGGILGLSAIVDSNPYSVPSYLPDILMVLCDHTADRAQLISSTAKSSLLEFKRTHVDSWKEHEQNFTDDQLALLANILISPSYYV